MRIDNREIRKILFLNKKNGISLNNLLEQLGLELNSENRMILTSTLQRDDQVLRIYQKDDKQIYTIYKFKSPE